MLAYFCFLLCVSYAQSARIHHRLESATAVAQKGLLLRDRYQLEEYSYTHHRATPGASFPDISSSRGVYDGAEHLGTGSFGDVWKAWDTAQGKMVAVKIFYQKVGGVKRYMTWNNADARGKRELEDSAEECTFVQKIMLNRKKYPLGASRICECYDSHIDDAKGTSAVVFLVQEMCGRDLGTQFIKPRKKSGRYNTWKARMVTKQMLQGIAFLQMFNPPLIHHDLKPANVCMNDEGQVKIIDWGGIVQGTYSNMLKPAVATPLYTPPEAKSRVKSFDSPYWSYDLYAVGLMHMELVCPAIEPSDWYYYTPLSSRTFTSVVERKCRLFSAKQIAEEVHIMAKLAAKRPSDRPNPMSFLDDPFLADVPTPQVQEEEKVHVLAFEVGAEVEYWSTTHQDWLPGVVGAVDRVHGTYDLLKSPPATKGADPWMRRGADPSRVRAPEKVLDASVDPKFVPQHSRFDGNEARGFENEGLLIPIREEPEQKPVVGKLFDVEKPVVGKLFDVEKPVVGKLFDVEKPVVGKLFDAGKPQKPQKPSDFFISPEIIPTTWKIEIERPKLYGSRFTGYTVQTFVKSPDAEVRDVESIMMTCKHVYPNVQPLPLEFKPLGAGLNLWSAFLKLPEKDPREEQLCEIAATVVMKDGKKMKSHPQMFRVSMV